MRLDQADRIMLGDREVSRVYLGANLVWGNAFSPASLFAQGEPGVWYDPSDFSTLFQDSAGTTPVTAVEQPVGVMLDKSGRSNHATQVTATSRPVLSARVNLLTKTEDISANDWSHYSIASRTTTKFIPSTAYGEHYIGNSTSKAATAIQYSARFDVKDEGYGFAPIVVGDWSGVVASNGCYICVNLSDGSYTTPGTFGSGWSIDTVTITRDSITGICTVLLSFTTSAVSTRVGVGIYAHPTSKASSPFAFSGNGTSGIYCSKIDLRVANQAHLPYQRVNTATDYDADPAKFPHYLRFDGVDDWLVTNTITPGTDKAQVFAGVRRLRSVPGEIIAETGGDSTSPGAFYLSAESSPNRYGYAGRGARIGMVNDQASLDFFPPPDTAVLTVTQDINGNTPSRMRRNAGAWSNSINTTFGGGNFLAYPLYIGLRAGTLFPFNGHLYSLIVRFGSNLPIATIENTEKYINTKTGAY